MYINTCTKCGQEFETKNPKRVVCPNCLYPDRVGGEGEGGGGGYGPPPQQRPGGYGPPRGGGYGPPQQHQGGYGPPRGGGYGPPQQHQSGYGPPRGGGYGPPQQHQGGYGPPRGPGGGGGYGPPRGPGGGGYGPPQQRQGGYGPPRGGGYGPPRGPGGGGFGPPRGPGGFGPPRRPGGFGGPRRGGPPKKLLVSKEMLIEIEKRYKNALPLPNPDIHELIAKDLELEPSKVFFGINLVRAKMKLPKLEYPKRKLAVTPDQLQAVELLYEPYLPTPPIGIHKIISKQLKMDEWRVHVAIGLIRKAKEMPRWNEERSDLPEAMKAQLKQKKEAEAQEAEGEPKPEPAAPKAKAKAKKEPKEKAASSEGND